MKERMSNFSSEQDDSVQEDSPSRFLTNEGLEAVEILFSGTIEGNQITLPRAIGTFFFV